MDQKDKIYKISKKTKDYNGALNTQFEEYEITQDDFKKVVIDYNYSLIVWRDGIRKEDNFMSASGCVVDIDSGLTIKNAASRLKRLGFNYLIVTSKSHTAELNKYHILLPFSFPVYCFKAYSEIVDEIHELFPELDPAVKDGARYFFGSPDDCLIYENWGGHDYDVLEKSPQRGLWDRYTRLFDKNKEIVEIVDTMTKTPIYCPFHEDGSPSAFVRFTGHKYFIHCSACDNTFNMYEEPGSWLARRCETFYSYKSDIWRFAMVGDVLGMHAIGQAKFHSFTKTNSKEYKKLAFDYVVNHKHLDNLNRIDHISDLSAKESYYTANLDEGVFVVHYAGAEVKLKDNKFIEKYISGIFGKYTDFIKQWIAVYTHSNYKRLPTLVFQGSRGCGKSVFAEVIASLFPSLSGSWDGRAKNFSHEVEKKFLIVEENVGDKVDQYVTLKRYSGSDMLTVRKLFKDPYQIKNNINICIVSNDTIPLFVKVEELPTNEKNNQFFVYEFPDLNPSDLDPTIKQKLIDRFGYYVRTELKRVYDNLDTSSYRYSIKTPVTSHEKALFENNATETDFEIEEIISELQDLVENPSLGDQVARTFLEEGYLTINYLKDNYRNPQKVVKNLIRKRLINGTTSKKQIGGYRKYCHEITQKFRDLIYEIET